MKKFMLGIGGLLVAGIILAVVIGIWVMGIFNTEVELDNRYEAQFNVVETQMDNMRKTLLNQNGVTEEYADTFLEVVQSQAGGRSGGGLLKLNRESESLGIPAQLYQTMLVSIQGELDDFSRQQNVLTDVWREHTTYCERFPNRFLIGGQIHPKPQMVTSKITKDAMITGELDDNLLGK